MTLIYLFLGTVFGFILSRSGAADDGFIQEMFLHRGNVAGGVLFGIGWSIAGMCPGPILVRRFSGPSRCRR